MTEAEWLTTQPNMRRLDFLRGRASDRQLRLAACAYCRFVWPFLGRACCSAVEMGEMMADGPVDEHRHRAVVRAAIQAVSRFTRLRGQRFRAADMAYRVPLNDGWYAAKWTLGNWTDLPASDRIFRDIFCNPFRPVPVNPSWLTSTVVAIAKGFYQDRAFDRLPILADALQDAGCEHPDILTHCREQGGHVRGCWVVDLMTGRT